ncbi:MAG: addiction module protein [Betaproteobacteria bacterium]
MNAVIHELVEQAQALPMIERAKLIESLIESMAHSDKEIEALWAIEAEDRIDALERGEIELEDEPRILTEFRARQK